MFQHVSAFPHRNPPLPAPSPRLESEGAALFDLAASPDHTLFRDAVLRFFLPGRPLPFHCLGQGDIVLVSPNNR